MFILASLSSSGCGGKEETSKVSDLAGLYRAAYSRAEGSVMIQVSESGSVMASVADGTDGSQPIFYSGSGSTDSTGYVTVVCTSPSTPGTVVIDGAFASLGSTTPYFEGSISSTSAGFNLSNAIIGLTTRSTANPFAGSYSGNYKLALLGRTQGTMTAAVAEDGTLTGTIVDLEQGTVAVTGTVNSVGAVTFAGTSSKADTSTFVGGFTFDSSDSKKGFGKWTSTAWVGGGAFALAAGS